MKFNSEDYVLTGATESSTAYMVPAVQGASNFLNGTFVTTVQNRNCRFYAEKYKTQNFGKEFLTSDHKDIEKVYLSFKKDFKKYDDLLYKMNFISNKDDIEIWKKVWNIFEKEMFSEYRIDTTDSLAEEVEAGLKKKLVDQEINPDLFAELIIPDEYTATQKINIEIGEERDIKNLIRKFWFINGTWNGGNILTEENVKKLKSELSAPADISRIMELHEKIDKKLKEETLNTIKILRALTLWREERKTHVQKITVTIDSIISRLANSINLPKNIVVWLQPHEINKGNLNLGKDRSELSFFVFTPNNEPMILTGEKAKSIVAEFENVEQVNKVKGMCASTGKAKGIVRVVIKKEQFANFEEGNILVTTMTRPEFVPLMKKVAAIITDEGGLTCHAAIVARELKKPCIIGTKIATKVLKDGDVVEVDADRGVVRILKNG